MCRSSTEDPGFYLSRRSRRRRDRLNIKAFYLRFSITSSFSNNNQKENPLPHSLTLHYLPRISGSPLDINDAPIPSHSPAFVTLHRITSHSPPLGEYPTKELVFASRERVRASEGVRFEVYWREEKVLKGVFRRKDFNDDDFIDFIGEWKVDCTSAVQSHVDLDLGLALLDVSLAEMRIEIECDGQRVTTDKVEMPIGTNTRMKKKKKKNRGFVGLEEIPEETEVEEDDSDSATDGDSSPSSSSSSSCFCGGGGGGGELELRSGGRGDGEVSGDEEKQGLEMEIEGVRWAVDVGIWVLCLGVGLLVSRASSNTFRRRRRSFLF